MFLKSNRTNWANERFRAAPAPPTERATSTPVSFFRDRPRGRFDVGGSDKTRGAQGERRRGRRINNYVSVLEKTINEEEGSVKPIVKTLVTFHEKLTVCHFVATFFCFKISAALKLCLASQQTVSLEKYCVCFF